MLHRVAPRASVTPRTRESVADESVNDLSRIRSPVCEEAPILVTKSRLEEARRSGPLDSAAAGKVSESCVLNTIRQGPMRNENVEHSLAGNPSICKPYLSIAELAQLTPWTDQAIRTMLSKGKLQEGLHFFYVGRRPIFKWAAIVAFIERTEKTDFVPHYRDQKVNGAKT